MKATVKIEKEIDFRSVHIKVPVRYEEEQIPNDFPLRVGDTWEATIDIDSGQISEWPKGEEGSIHLKVCDEGIYTLFDEHGSQVGSIEQNYAPNGLIPGEYGDYVIMDIGQDGIVKNWPTHPCVEEFFPAED